MQICVGMRATRPTEVSMVPNGYKKTEIGVIPLDWEVVKLGDIADVKGGKRLPKGSHLTDNKTSYPYIRVTNMFMGGIDTKGILYVPEDVQPKIKNYIISKDDLFISVAGTLGLVGEIPIELDGANLTENADKITNIKANKKYLFYVLSSNLVQNIIINETTVNAQPKLALTRIKTFLIPLPPLTQQQKIVKILSTADEKIEAITFQIEKAEMVKKGLLQKLLSEGIGHSEFKESGLSIVYPMRKIPNSWNLQKLSDITTKITDGAHFTPTYVEEGVPFLRVTDLKSQDLLSSKIKYIPKKEHLELLKRCNPEYGDILYSKNGTIGLTRIVTWNWEFSIFVSLCLIKPNKELIIPEYLKFYLTSSIVHTQIKIRAKQGAVTNLHLEEIRDFFITVPPLKEQTKIANILTTADEKLEVLRAKKAKYEELKVGLMQKLLTGEVRV